MVTEYLSRSAAHLDAAIKWPYITCDVSHCSGSIGFVVPARGWNYNSYLHLPNHHREPRFLRERRDWVMDPVCYHYRPWLHFKLTYDHIIPGEQCAVLTPACPHIYMLSADSFSKHINFPNNQGSKPRTNFARTVPAEDNNMLRSGGPARCVVNEFYVFQGWF
jgi:hypothetical protein